MRRLGVALAVAIAVMVLGGCSGIPQDGRYQTGGGGWDNFRAEALNKGSGPSLADLMAGQIDLYTDQLTTSLPHIRVLPNL